MTNSPFHIIIIDDNPDIHRDFIKILTLSNSVNQFNELDRELFGENIARSETVLPEFDIDTATQGSVSFFL
ncbi:MAG: hypothetical protein WC785_04820 [Tatlockia sp.]|jgi:hypothetical protein